SVLVTDLGAGPSLYACGSFRSIDGIAAPGAARFDGLSWHSLGSTLDIDFRALAAVSTPAGPRLIAAGGGGYGPASDDLALMWDGAAWSSIGAHDPSMTGIVHALAVLDRPAGSKLVMGGDFGRLGTASADNIAIYDGASLSPLVTSHGLSGSALA